MTAPVETPPIARPPRPEFLGALWAFRKVLGIGALAGLVIGLAVALTRPTMYTSSATLLFPSAPASRLTALTGATSEMPSLPLLEGALVVPQPGTSAATATVLVQSRRSHKDVLRTLKDRGTDLAKIWRTNEELTLLRMSRRLHCRQGKQGELYVSFTDSNAERACQIAQTYVDELGFLSKELGLDPAERNEEFLQGQLTKAENKLTVAQTALLKFQRENRIIALPEQSAGLAQQYSGLQTNVTNAALETEMAMRQLNLMAAHAQRLLVAFMDVTPGPGNTLGPLYAKVTAFESDLALLRFNLTEDHPDVQQKKRALGEAQRMLKEELKRQLGLLKTGSSPAIDDAVVKAAVAQARVAGLRTALAETEKQVQRLPQQQAVYLRLSAEVNACLDGVKLIRGEMEKARLIAQSRGPIFVVLDPAEAPRQRDPKGRALILALALFLGISLAALLPYRDWARRVRDHEGSCAA